MPRFPALIFDLDGTLTPNMELHAAAFAVFLERYGLGALTPDLRRRLDGKRNRDIFPILFGRELPPEECKTYADEKEALYRQLSKGRLLAVRGLHRLLDVASSRGLALAIATSAPLENVAHTLSELKLDGLFGEIVRGDEVPRGKPHPDVFLEAARRVGHPARDCLAFEDAPMGLLAASSAGMTCLGLATSFSKDELHTHGGATAVFTDYDAILDSEFGQALLAS